MALRSHPDRNIDASGVGLKSVLTGLRMPETGLSVFIEVRTRAPAGSWRVTAQFAELWARSCRCLRPTASDIRLPVSVCRLTAYSHAMRIIRRRPSPAMVVALIALFIALGGSSYAALRVGSREIADNTIRSRDVHNHSLTRHDLARNGRTHCHSAVSPNHLA